MIQPIILMLNMLAQINIYSIDYQYNKRIKHMLKIQFKRNRLLLQKD